MASLKLGDSPVGFELKGVDGNVYSLDDIRGGMEAYAVIFMCNHCPYVLAWEDRLIGLQEEFEDRGVAFVGINANDAEKYPADSFENMVTHAEEKGLNFPYLHDKTQELARAYGAERTPEVFLFNGDDELVYHGAPDDSHDPESVTEHWLRDALEAALSGSDVPVAETDPVGCTIKWK